jgi:hypothetical protein
MRSSRCRSHHRALAGGVALTAALLVLAFPAVAMACPICFQVEDAQTINGVRAGVLVLMSVTVAVLGGVAAFSVRIWRHEKANRTDA